MRVIEISSFGAPEVLRLAERAAPVAASGEVLMTHVPSHHNHAVGEWIGIRAEVDHVVTFERGSGASSPPAPGVARAHPV